jgi:hypothetical protein
VTSLRKLILDDVVTAVDGVAALTGRVHRWRPTLPDTALPYAFVLSTGGTPVTTELGKERVRLTADILIVAEFDADTAGDDGIAVLDPLITSVQQALMADEQWSSRALMTNAAGWRTVPPDPDRPNEVRAIVEATIDYRYDLGDPETDS